MLSILIPTYNYNIFPLANEIHKQCIATNVVFEILCQDDCSNSSFNIENEKINTLSHASFIVAKEKLGRGKNLNSLAATAQYDYLLILEADAIPKHEDYIFKILESLNNSSQVLFGGVTYPDYPKNDNQILRWKFGNDREIKSLNHRLKKPYDFTFSWNLVIKKNIFDDIRFVDQITVYGYDDLIFRKKLKENCISIHHIDNPLVHINEEDSLVFLEKCKKASLDAYNITKSKIVNKNDISLTKVFYTVEQLRLKKVFAFAFAYFESQIKKNLLSKNPSLLLLDFYKLGYLCKKTL